MISELVSTVIAYEKRGNVQGGIKYLFGMGLTGSDLSAITKALIIERHYLSAYALADRLIVSGWDKITVRLIRGAVSAIIDAKEQYEIDFAFLKANPPESFAKCDEIWAGDWITSPLNHMFHLEENHRVFKIGALVQLVDSRLTPIYDEKLSNIFNKRCDGLPLLASRMAVVKPIAPKKVIVACRERFFPSISNSRYHEIGPRLVAGMNKVGWDAVFHPLSFSQSMKLQIKDYKELGERSQSLKPDLIILDQPRIIDTNMKDFFKRISNGGTTLIIGLYLDPWAKIHWPEMLDISQYLDLIWSAFASVPIWKDTCFNGKTFFSPLLFGTESRQNNSAVTSISFNGGVGYYNWQRALWLSAMKFKKMPINIELSSHSDDGLSAEASSEIYFDKLSKISAAINFSMRNDFSRTQTGRTFEIVFSGALLIQEESDDINLFFTPNKHYLPFRTFGDLKNICSLLNSRADNIFEIREAGLAFYNEYYSDHRIISTLDNRLLSLVHC